MAPPQAIGPLASERVAAQRPARCWCGDAAGFYDPVHRRGRHPRAAQRRARRRGRRRPPARRHGGLVASTTGARGAATRDKFRLNRLLQRVVARPALANAMARRLQRRPDLADRLVGIAGDFVPAQAALRLGMSFDLLRA